MKYVVRELFEHSHCRIVFVEDVAIARDLEASILESHPEYQYEINKVFHPKIRFGPFLLKNKKPLWKILDQSEAVRKENPTFRQLQEKRLDLYYYENRRPSALSTLQRLRASVLYDVMSDRFNFLINDYHYEGYRSNCYTIASWMMDYKGFEFAPCELIWITSMNPEDVIGKLGQELARKYFYHFYKVTDREITECGKEELISRYQKTLQPPKAEKPVDGEKATAAATPTPVLTSEQKYQEGRKYDSFSGMGMKQLVKDDPEKASVFYLDAAIEGHLASGYCLGRYFERIIVNLDVAVRWYANTYFHEGAKNPTDDETVARLRAASSLLDLILQFPKGSTILRNQFGDDAVQLVLDQKEILTKIKELSNERIIELMKS